MKTFFTIAFGLHAYVCCAQLVEHFNDENFSSDPLWSGTSSHFIVNASQQLQLNNTIAGTSYLSAPFVADSIDGYEWEAYVKQTFAPSGSNFGRIYLVSDQSSLTSPLNGYYLQLGEAGSLDAVELFRQAGTVHTSICRATNAAIALSFSIRLRVTRSDTGLWTLYIDYAGGTSFVEEAHGTDTTFSEADYFGVVCIYTASNANKFFFDDLLAGPPLGDLSPPELTGFTVSSQSELHLEFSEAVDSASASTANFSVNDGVGNPIMTELSNEQKSVKLTFSSAFLNGKLYTLSINGIADLSSNEMTPEEQLFRYFVSEPAVNGDIVFNELFTDPSPVVGLPAFEFVEIFNKSQKAFDLANWTLSDLISTATLPTTFILPGEYLVITATGALSLYVPYGPTLAVSEMPTLNNTSDAFVLREASGNVVDSVRYSLSWFQDEDKQLGGYTLERLLPELQTNEPLNWMASEAIIGGTPGAPNSVLGRNPDSKAPIVDTLILVNQNTLALIFNEALDSASLQPSAFRTGKGLVPSMVRMISHVVVELGFADYFVNGADDDLVIIGIKDLAGNVLDTTELAFRYFVPGPVTPGILLINEIMADPSPTVQLPEAEYIEVINVSDSPMDLQGWTLTDGADTVTLPSGIVLPHEYLVLASTTNAVKFIRYGQCLGVTGFPSLTNSGEPLTLRSPAGVKIDSVFYHQSWLGGGEKADGGWSLERLDLAVVSGEPTNWRASIDTLGGTPARRNSVAGMNPDSKAPSLDSLLVRSDRELDLMFTEAMDSVAASSVGNYFANGRYPADAALSGLGTKVSLRFDSAFVNGVNQFLLVSGLTDLAGNEMDSATVPFRYFVPGEIAAGVLLIDEIMADPSPTVQLPEAEYVEIINTSDSPFDLQGWTLADAMDTVTLPSGVILPHEYLVLASTTNATKFSQYGRCLGVMGFPSLTNSGEPLALRSPAGIKIDSVFYHQAWLGGGEKADGGWSLERLDLAVVSVEPTNWRASIDTLGGTPARKNSVAGMNPDSKAPKLDSLLVRSNRELDLVFTEPLDTLTTGNVFNYSAAGKHPADATKSGPGVISLHFDSLFANGVDQQLIVTRLKDLAGNEMDSVTVAFRYFVPGEITAGVLLINEIMADPSPTVQLPEAEYIEIISTSDSPFDLQGWTLTDATDTVTLPWGIILPHEYLLLTSTTNAAKFTPYGRCLGVAGFPSLTNSGEPLTLRSPTGMKIDSVFYHQAWLGGGEKADGGWSLERLDLAVVSVEPTNWRASIDTLGGTPARKNSVAGMNPDSKAPKLDSLLVRSNRELDLVFTEAMDSLTASSVGNYFANGRYPADAALSGLGTKVSLRFDYAFVNGVNQLLLVSGLTDLAGNEMDSATVPFRYFVPGEIAAGVLLINEIMADPSPTVQLPEAEYIEVINTSDSPFDLQGWTLTDAIDTVTLPFGIILPHEYLVLTSTTNSAKFIHYGRCLGVMGFPSLTNSGEPLTLMSPTGVKIDSVFYHQAWLGGGEKADGGWSLERLNLTVVAVEPTNWRASIDTLGGTPARVNSVAGMNPDSKAPSLDSLLVRSNRILDLIFTEPLDTLTTGNVFNYSAAGKHPADATKSSPGVISLHFDSLFANGVDQQLIVTRLKDLAGNEMDSVTVAFRYFALGEITAGVLLINEIMADPSPTVQLPEAEYIEIISTSDSPFDLQGWTLTDATDTVTLPWGIILPHEYLLLTSTTNAAKFTPYGRCLGVAGFPSLTNNGEPLTLRSPAGMKIDSVFYHQAWLGGGEKADGGWSLERLDLAVVSVEPTNWRASIDTLGGTPARKNSVAGMNPDSKAPKLDSLLVRSNRELDLVFTEAMDSLTASSVGNYFANGRYPADAALSGLGTKVSLRFDYAFVNGVNQLLLVSGLTDLAGNEMDSATVPFRYFVPGEIAAGVLLINEIMADPSPTVQLPEAEYIEVINTSDSPFDLQGWTLTDAIDTVTLPFGIILPHEYLVLTSTTNSAKFIHYGRCLGVMGFPSLTNSGEPLTLRSPTGVKIDSVFYHQAWLGGGEKADGGWSLERLNLSIAALEPTNWRASVDTLGGTPARVNSLAGMNPDSKEPRLDSLLVESNRELHLVFSESMDSLAAISLEHYSAGGKRPVDATISRSGARISLRFDSAFVNGIEQQLLVSGLKDLAGNAMDSVKVSFRYFVPGEITAGVLLINEIMADPSPTVQLPEAEYVEIISTSDSPFDLQGWTLTDATNTVTLPSGIILPHEYLLLTSTTNAAKFTPYGRCLGVAGFPSLTNSGEPLTLRSPTGVKIDSVFYHQAWLGGGEKADGGWSLERLDLAVVAVEASNWRVSIDTLGGTPARRNSVAGMNPDSKSPSLDSLLVRGNNVLDLLFTEAMDSITASSVLNYSADGKHPTDAAISGPGARITLRFDSAFVNGVDQQLSVSGLKDLAGNEFDSVTVSFRYFVPGEIAAGVLLINEIMADPSPTVQLPEAEFIEVINTSDSPFDLRGWTLTDATDTVALPFGIILPHEYLVLASTTNAFKFTRYGRCLGVMGFPSLTNSGEPLTLRSPTGVKIDSVFYHQAWLGGGEKADGGWSLERLDMAVVSNEPTNWRASIDTLGGTPARRNSVAGMNPDSKSPSLDSLLVRGNNVLDLLFTEAMDSITASSVLNYSADGKHPTDAAISGPGARITLRFDSTFVNGVDQRLSVSGLKDLAGNEIDSVTVSFRYFVPGEIAAGVLLINEIMADPSPTVQLPEAEFIEVINTTDSPFDLQGWTLTDATDTVTFPSGIILPHEYLVLASTTNAAKFSRYGRCMGITGFPSLTNSGEPLTLGSPTGMKIDSVFYHQAWLGGGEKADGGWSLERLALAVVSVEPTNWRASIDTLGGTPARVNSMEGMNPDSKAPTLDSLLVRSDRELSLIFSEAMDSATATNILNYSVDGRHPADATASGPGTKVSLRFETAFENGCEQHLMLSGMTDVAGNEMQDLSFPFIYFISGAVVPGVVLINEIMADPVPMVELPEAEFIEIVNISSMPINLIGWMLSDATTTCTLPSIIIHPNEFVILTSTGNAQKFDTSSHVVGVTGFPSLNNSGEPLSLRSSAGQFVDSVQYDARWFGDDPKQDGGWTLERLQYNFSSSAQINWKPSLSPRGGTPGKVNSQFGMNPDDRPPQILSVLVPNARTVQLRFDEPIDEWVTGTSIKIDSTEFDVIEWSVDEVHCRRVNDLENGRPYKLLVVGVTDTAGNVMPAVELTLRYFVPSEVHSKDLIINEIMPDPSPVVGLPEAEYVEIFNRSTTPVNLLGWEIADANTTAVLTDRIVMPNEFLLLTSSAGLLVQNSLTVAGFPSLDNDGDCLVLRAPLGTRVDSIKYNRAWYRASDKLDGGWSLELIDPMNPCGEQDNWAPSEDESGGTPGRVNSVMASKPDLTGPGIVRVVIESQRSILVEFDEKLGEGISTASFTLTPGAGQLSVAFAEAALRTIRTTASEELKMSTPYVLNVSNLFDCNGNRIRDQHSSYSFTLPEDPLEGDIVINEILFNPRPGGPDFIEIYNQGSRYLDLKDWWIARTDVEDHKETIEAGQVLAPKTFLVFTTDRDRLLSDYPQTPGEVVMEASLPSMPDDHAAIALGDGRNHILDSLTYDEGLHSALISDPEGVSLERISMAVSASEPSNWRSAAESAGFATPGLVNSNSRGDRDESADEFFVSPEVISPNSADNFAMIFYRFSDPGNFINCRVFDQQGHLVRVIANNMSVGLDGFLRWDGDTEEGDKARAGYYIVLLDYFDTESAAHSVRMRVVVAPR